MKNTFTLKRTLVSVFAVMSMAMNGEVIYHTTDDGFSFSLDTETKNAELTKYNGSEREVTIPESVTYEDEVYNVTSLGTDCFSYSSLTSVNIPASVISLGEYCFFRCRSLTSVSIPSSVTTLGYMCFYYCTSLTSINIPSSVTSIDEGCFGGCSSLASITVDENNKVYDSRENCNAIIETVTNTMMYGCTTTKIPTSVTSLGKYCFFDCSSLTSINIPAFVTSIEEGCFNRCSSLKSITVDENNKVYDSRENCNAIIETATNKMIQGCENTIIPSSITSLGKGCFAYIPLKTIDIPSSVISLGISCFQNCTSLVSVNIPTSVTSLEEMCFESCSSLKTINIPTSVTSLGMYCFISCYSLEAIEIPASVTSLGTQCFDDCRLLTTVVCKMPTALSGNFFSSSTLKKATLYVPEEYLEQYKATEPWSNFANIVGISSAGIGNNAVSEPATIKEIYNLEGKKTKGANGRVNIIKMSDGTTRKVLNMSR